MVSNILSINQQTKNDSIWYDTQAQARQMARQKMGHNPVEIEPNKLRRRDGTWQYRAKPGDLAGDNQGPHIHLEKLDPKTGDVLINLHLRWRK